MSAPLYQDAQVPSQCGGNFGLWFDRFYDQYNERDWSILKPDTNDNKKGNTHWLTKHFKGAVGDKEALELQKNRQAVLAESIGGSHFVCKASWHFVTGMGNPHPVDNGFAWHPTLGVPYLTGAAVKGLLRTYIEKNLRIDEASGNPDKKQLLLDWFGSTDKDPRAEGYESQIGEIVFFDALPIEPVSMGVDVMTPHMGKWYESGANRPNEADTVPADWHDPVPVSFLVAKDISLQFSFGLRTKSSQSKVNLDDVREALERVLVEMGAGAKTATGYGEMVELERIEQRKEEAKQAIAFENATKLEGYYLKVNLRNNSLFLEKSGKQVAFLSSAKAPALFETLPAQDVATLKGGKKGVKVDALVDGKDILQVELFEK